MKHHKLTRALSLLLAAVTVLALSAAPGQALQYGDIQDKEVSQAVDALSTLNIVNGTGNGQFSPDGTLTRAQLCKMAIEVMGLGGKVKAQTYRTIFKDMGGNHWARGYVNLAATTEVPEGSGTRLMLGLGDGTFAPDRVVTYREAVTLVLRILGYSEEANRSWPAGALEMVEELGLSRGIEVANPAGPITRGQTALLFYRLLFTPAKGQEEPYGTNLGKPEKDVIVLSTNATVNNQTGCVVVAKDGAIQTYHTAAPLDSSLQGARGWALIDKEGRFVTLFPDDESTYVTGSVSRKQAFYLTLSDHGRYALSENTPVYTGADSDSEVTTYKEYMASLRTGDMVTLYLDGEGKVVGLYRGETSAAGRFVVVMDTPVTPNTFYSLTGENEQYTVRKNGHVVSMSAIRKYDVATYDPVTKVLDVCDVRLSCIYENASPSYTAPDHVTAAGGNTFSVMADAISDFSSRRIGDSITLMFAANGMVAGVLPDRAGVTSEALGVFTKDGFQLLGCNVTLTKGLPDDLYRGDVVNIYSNQRGALLTGSAGSYINTQFNPRSLRLDGKRVSQSVQVYERTEDGGLIAKDLSSLPGTVNVTQYHEDGSGQVDIIILGSYSGDGAVYGKIDTLNGYRVIRVGTTGNSGDTDGLPVYMRQSAQKVVFTTVDGSTTYETDNGRFFYTGYGALTLRDGKVSYVTRLQSIGGVRSSSFYTENGITYVRTSQGVFEVDEDVQCYNTVAAYAPQVNPPSWAYSNMWHDDLYVGEWRWSEMEWFPQAVSAVKFDSLSECRNYAETVTIYLDTQGKKVRIVEAS